MPSILRTLLLLVILSAGVFAALWALHSLEDTESAGAPPGTPAGAATATPAEPQGGSGRRPDQTPNGDNQDSFRQQVSPDPWNSSATQGLTGQRDPSGKRGSPNRRTEKGVVRFRGLVLDPFDSPLSGCRVLCEPMPTAITVSPSTSSGKIATRRTGADGRFEISVLATDKSGSMDEQLLDYVVSLSHPDYEPRVAVKRCLSPFRDASYDLGSFTLESGTGIAAVAVEAETGRPVEGTHVQLRPEFTDPTLPAATVSLLERTAKTDARGQVVFGGVPRGSYLLRFASDDHIEREMRIANHPPPPQPTGALLRVELEPSQVLRGRLISADGDPIADAVLRAYCRDEPQSTAVQGISGDTGDFRIARIRKGAYCLTVDTREHGTKEIPDLVVPAGFPFTIRMPPRSDLLGRVYQAQSSGRRQPTKEGVLIELEADTVSAVRLQRTWVAQTRQDGRFSIRAIPPGRYRVRVASQARHGQLSTLHDVVQIPFKRPQIEWILQPTIRLRGRVVLPNTQTRADGRPQAVANAKITIMPLTSTDKPSREGDSKQSPFEILAESAADQTAGSGWSRHSPTSLRLTRSNMVSSDSRGFFVFQGVERMPLRLAIRVGAQPAFVSRVIDLRPSPGAREYDVGEIRIQPRQLVSVRVTVTRPGDSAPVPGASVDLEPVGQPGRPQLDTPNNPGGMTDSFGRLTLESVPVGRYLLRAHMGQSTVERHVEFVQDGSIQHQAVQLPRRP